MNKKLIRTGIILAFTFAFLFGLSAIEGQKINFKNLALVANAREAGSLVLSERPLIQSVSDGALSYKVIRVIDGDTLVLQVGDSEERVRLIGIDTPETLDPRKPVQCFGKEASGRAKEMLEGKNVLIKSDATQMDRDKYGRLLRYVFLEDGTSFNKYMIENGFAHEYTYTVPYEYQTEFKNAEKVARSEKRGMWGECDL